MACIIHIETATKTCSLAVSNNGNLLYNKKNAEGFSHSASLGVFAEEAIQFLQKNNLKPEAVAVSEGPGSYTGLRIGVSLAKGLCYGFEIPLIAVQTLKILTEKVRGEVATDWYCPMIDARRMEVYAAVYDGNLEVIRPVQAEIIDDKSFAEYLSKGKVAFFGDGSDKCKAVIDSPNAVFIDGVFPEAAAMVDLAEKAFAEKAFVDTAYFEPFYLKEFQATTPKLNKALFLTAEAQRAQR
jgi:tRNA threonylcarbamoyladenosine biosynthesis protein TsaB